MQLYSRVGQYSEVVTESVSGPVREMITMVEDGTRTGARRSLKTALRESRQRYRGLFSDCPVPLWKGDLSSVKASLDSLRMTAGQDFRSYLDDHPECVMSCAAQVKVLDVNKATTDFLGATNDQEARRCLSSFLRDAPLGVLKDILVALAEGQTRIECESVIVTLRAEMKTVSLRLSPVPGHEDTLSEVVISLVDNTERRLAEERLRDARFRDALTGLYNRAYFQEEMRRLERGRDYPITIVSTDIDGLQQINENLGYEAGDSRIRAYAEILRASVRGSDLVARVGGDEFAVILARADGRVADALCERLEWRIKAHNRGIPDVPLSASFGVETSHGADQPLESAFKRAERKRWRVKVSSCRSVSHGVVDALLLALSAKDYVCEGHTRRVRGLATLLGRAIGLSKPEMAELALLAEMHDLGKVGVSDRILLKEGPLTVEEQIEMKEHSAIGYTIAEASAELSDISSLILHHHEWWDGSGYPVGLKGEEIPIACRILAIVDAYDAMINDRPYRKAMTPAQALHELRRCAGTQFDPGLVETFVSLGTRSKHLREPRY